jgi:predicted dehydrogenase
MPERYKACLVGCGRMGATIDDEVRDHPDSHLWLPYSHAAACVSIDRLSLVAVADVVPEKVEQIRQRYQAPHGYTDYRDMIREERPDLLCIATRPPPHAETVRFAAENGVRAIYCEKPLCCSMEEADSMVEACEQHGIHFNYGTQRRYSPLFRWARERIAAGEIGRLEAVIAHCGPSAAMWGHTHTADMLMYLAGDLDAEFVQATAAAREEDWDGDRLLVDPGLLMGYVRFANGVHGYLSAATGDEYEVRGDRGSLRLLNNGSGMESWRVNEPGHRRERTARGNAPPGSGTVNGLLELIAAMDGAQQTTGGIRRARASQEIILGWMESHRRQGVRVPLPLANRQLAIRPPEW